MLEYRADKTRVLVTGPSPGGIGAETAISLAKGKPAVLILAGRSQGKIQSVIEEAKRVSPTTAVHFLHLELDSQTSCREAAEAVKKLDVHIDGLINNAAVMACPFSKTKDDIEMQFGTNHIGHFLFTNLLLQAGAIASGARIVNVSSSASEIMSPQFDDLTYQDGKTYEPWAAYSTSKMANVLYARDLADKLRSRNISSFSLNPGSIKTGLQQHIDEEAIEAALEKVRETNPDFVRPSRKSLQEGCSTTLRAALDPALTEHSGAYLNDCQIIVPELHVSSYAHAEKVWKLSEGMVGEAFDF